MIKKILSLLIASLLMGVLFAVNGVKTSIARADESGQVTVMLHHRLSWDNLPAQTANDGLERAGSDGLIAGANTAFAVYDISSQLKSYSGDSAVFLSQFKTMDQAAINSYIADHSLVKVAEKTTDAQGIASFNLTNGLQQAYLIVQLQNNEQSVNQLMFEQRSDPIAFSLPIYAMNSNVPLSVIHLYTKSAIVNRIPYFFKYGRTRPNTQMPLAGAKFAFYQLIAGKKSYLTNANGWQASDHPLTDPAVRKIVSGSNGLVALDNSTLAAGSYYFEELQTLTGYEISAAATQIKVEIPAASALANIPAITVNGQALAKTVAGQIPADVFKNASPRVYNYEKAVKSSNGQVFPFLPQTGESIGLISLAGLLAILATSFIWLQKKKRNLEK
ncbi:MAG: pilin N-terminal domain-containing protein [Oenococcus sp.]|uniref:pilin N-terminal domain-containing protein n=1 Tax=Oenococcus sp. TaxID=1979414 RepID=UPI0039E93F69